MKSQEIYAKTVFVLWKNGIVASWRLVNIARDADALPNVFIMLTTESGLKENGYSTKMEVELVSSVGQLRETYGIWIIFNLIVDTAERI